MLHHDLPIHRTGVALLGLAIEAQQHMPRGIKRQLGDKLSEHCVAMLDLMAMANASRGEQRVAHIDALLRHLRATQVLLRAGVDCKWVAIPAWANSVQLLESIGRQAGGWLKRSRKSAVQTPAT